MTKKPQPLSAMPISRLSVLLIMSVCVGTLLLSSLVHAWHEARSARAALGEELRSVATLLGNRSTAAIAFDDGRTATENLAALADVQHVDLACLYGEQGSLFAQFVRRPGERCPGSLHAEPEVQAQAQALQLEVGSDYVRVRLPIHIDRQRVALLRIDSSLAAVNQRLLRQLQQQAGVVLVAALLALAVALRMQGLISTPLRRLAEVAKAIVGTRDYSLRAASGGPQELGELAQAFNGLMATIEQQNAALEAARLSAQQRFEAARANQAALSALAKSPAALAADADALAATISAQFAALLQVDRVQAGLQGDVPGDVSWGAQGHGAPSSEAPVLQAGLAHWNASGERVLAIADVNNGEAHPDASQALRQGGVRALVWAGAGGSQGGQGGRMAWVSFELGQQARSWSSETVAVACELADLLALVERDSRRRRAEQSLRASEAYNKLLFRESCMAQLILDPRSLRLIDCNRAAVEVFGAGELAHLLGRMPAQLLPPRQADGRDSALCFQQRLDAALAGERSVFEMQFLREGQAVWDAEVHLDLFEADAHSLLQFSLIDISARVQAQRALEQLNSELESRVLRRTEALSEANCQLSETLETLQRTKDELVRNERLASLGALVAGVAHELNTPIGNSLVVASTLEEHSAQLAEEVGGGTVRRASLGRYLDMARESSALLMRSLQRAAELVSRFKQVAVDPSAGQRCRFDLGLVLGELAESLRPQFLATPHRLLLDLPAGIVMEGWPAALEQVVAQLVANTLVHAHQPERPGLTRISATLGEDGSHVRLIVADDGRGIEAQALPRIFDPFYTTRLGSGGNGLGLHTVFSLVKQSLGGRISVESVPGQGARFIVDIPCVAPQRSLAAGAH